MSARTFSLLCTAAAVAAAALTVNPGRVAARDKPVTIAIAVNSRGLNLSQPADVHTFYRRIADAAWVACTDGNRVGLAPLPDPQGCYGEALARAIRSAGNPLLTQIYLETHTFREAVARGVVGAAQVAAN